ncbi:MULTISPECIES: DUF4148 domain-containing protein [Paraburkholderia]|jgi:hypothetical protein|uniref:DUF4148 domain-containing protein n=1 Tax=Paraburkholderia phenazinium TaxID=60549 RepID=A0A1N6GMQ3_9BURK|nr:DUF4148 domain-containing protein [Paraburkholderia phenazinium]SIO08795.1 protein of unknown function [Paraburkholderia phenazinium]
MKALKIAALLSILATGTAFAQSNPATNAPADNATTTVAMSNATPQVGTWVPPTGQAVAPKTRAEVYGELVHAEKDGQLAYLNSTVYAHP